MSFLAIAVSAIARPRFDVSVDSQSCKSTLGAPPDSPDSSAISGVLHLQPENSRMF